MKSKLTLRIDDSLIEQAKLRARQKGTSVSRMIADYLSLIEAKESSSVRDLPPITASLAGILKKSDIGEEDYKKYLEVKYRK